jgi:hypothetical protein
MAFVISSRTPYSRLWTLILRVVSLGTFVAGLWLTYSQYRFLKSCSTCAADVSNIIYSPALPGVHSHYTAADAYSFDYTFLVGGNKHIGHGITEYNPGKSITVYYNPASPFNSNIELPSTQIAKGMIVIGALFSLALFPWRLVFRDRQSTRNVSSKSADLHTDEQVAEKKDGC